MRNNHNNYAELRVIIDMPSCGSYDMSLEKPDLFIKDKHGRF